MGRLRNVSKSIFRGVGKIREPVVGTNDYNRLVNGAIDDCRTAV